MIGQDRLKGVISKAREGWRHWQTFKEIKGGHRFQSRYHLHQRRRKKGEIPGYWTLINLIGGPILIVAGFVFLPTPGPSYIIIVIGLLMLSGEFLPLARVFDWTSVRLGNVWAGSNKTERTLVILAIAACIVALIYWLL